MAVDTRLLAYWREQQAARRHAWESLPERWRIDPRPEMAEVSDVLVESIARTRLLDFVADDR